MRFQRGPVMAYVAVVLIGLLVIIQTLSPDTSALHRVPRTLSGQADFTVVPPTPDPAVSGVSTIPSTPPGADDADDEDGDRDESAEPERQKGEKPDAKPTAPGGEQPDAPPSPQPEEPPADPGEGEDETTTPPTLVPSVGPVPGIMAPLLWPFVAEEDARPIDEAVPMFLRQLIAADAGVPVDALPLEVPESEREGQESTEESEQQPEKDSPARDPEAEQIIKDACDLTAAIAEGVEKLPGAGDKDPSDSKATPECTQACAEPESPVGSSPAADPEASADPAVPSDDASSEAPKPEREPKDGSTDKKTCAEKSGQ